MALPYQRTGDLQKAVQQIINNLGATTGAANVGTTDGLGVQADINALQSFAAIPVVSVTTATGSFNTVEKYVSPAGFSIPGGMTLGQVYRLHLLGTCTTSVANNTTFRIRFGANGTTADASIGSFVLAAVAAGTAIPFKLVTDVIATAVGASVSVLAYIQVVNFGGAQGITGPNQALTLAPTMTAFANNVTGILGMTLQSAAATTSYNILAAYSEVVR